MAECRRIDPDHIGPNCGCPGEMCVIDAPEPEQRLLRDIRHTEPDLQLVDPDDEGPDVRPLLEAYNDLVERNAELRNMLRARERTIAILNARVRELNKSESVLRSVLRSYQERERD